MKTRLDALCKANELGTDRDPTSAAWPSEIVPGLWLFRNIRGGLSLRYAP
ncbi:MAG: hypothetical protein ACOVSW_02265 [Candidatus Kapaibacteriota bacterium]